MAAHCRWRQHCGEGTALAAVARPPHEYGASSQFWARFSTSCGDRLWGARGQWQRPHTAFEDAIGLTRRSERCLQVLACDIDLLNPPAELEKRKHKLKRLVASPNSYFMDVKCQGCFTM
jgi:hypothetical protein